MHDAGNVGGVLQGARLRPEPRHALQDRGPTPVRHGPGCAAVSGGVAGLGAEALSGGGRTDRLVRTKLSRQVGRLAILEERQRLRRTLNAAVPDCDKRTGRCMLREAAAGL
jgi:hypothetical protein